MLEYRPRAGQRSFGRTHVITKAVALLLVVEVTAAFARDENPRRSENPGFGCHGRAFAHIEGGRGQEIMDPVKRDRQLKFPQRIWDFSLRTDENAPIVLKVLNERRQTVVKTRTYTACADVVTRIPRSKADDNKAVRWCGIDHLQDIGIRLEPVGVQVSQFVIPRIAYLLRPQVEPEAGWGTHNICEREHEADDAGCDFGVRERNVGNREGSTGLGGVRRSGTNNEVWTHSREQNRKSQVFQRQVQELSRYCRHVLADWGVVQAVKGEKPERRFFLNRGDADGVTTGS